MDGNKAAYEGAVDAEQTARLKARIEQLERENRTLNNSLRQAEEAFQNSFDLGVAGRVIYDAHAQMINVNDRMCEILGYTRDELLERSWKEFTNPDDREEAEKLYQRLLRGESNGYSMNSRFIRRDGEPIPVHLSIRAITNQDGTVERFIGLLHDLSELKEMEHSRDLLHSLVNTIPDIVTLKDAEGRYLFVNSTFLRIMGFQDCSSVLGKTAPEIWGTSCADDWREVELEKVLAGEAVEDYIVTSELPAGRRTISYSSYPQKNSAGNITGMLTLGRDVTRLHEATKLQETSNRDYRAIFNNISDIFFRLGEDGKIHLFSPSGLKLLGWDSFEQLEGRNAAGTIISSNEFSHFRHALNSTGSVTGLVMTLKKRGGGEVFVETNARLLKHLETGELYTEGIFRDITKRLAAEKELRKISSAIEHFSAALLILDKLGRIEYANRRFQLMTGYVPGEVMGRTAAFLSQTMSGSFFSEIRESITEVEEWQSDLLLTRKDGSNFWAQVSATSLPDERNNSMNYVAVIEDITPRKNMEKDLYEAKAKAEENSSIKSTILANISHELRTPMNGILGFAQLLRDEMENVEQYKMVDKIVHSSKRLMRTLNSIIDLSLIETDELAYNEQDLAISSVLDMVVLQYDQYAGAKQLSLTVEQHEELFTHSDMRSLVQIISNLLDNAIKFTSNGGVTVKAEKSKVGETGDDYICVSVIDTGIGLSTEHKELIFEEFRQVSEGIARNYEGMGLGLSVAKRFALLLDGWITVESTPGVGSTFTLWIPDKITDFELDDKPSTQPVEIASAGGYRSTLLLVEDNAINREVTTMFIEDDFDVESAESGEKAVRAAREKRYDGILMDINLGDGIDGIQAAKEIRKIEGYDTVPIFAITGYAMPGDEKKLLEQGCDYYLSKPFQREDLLYLLHRGLYEKPQP